MRPRKSSFPLFFNFALFLVIFLVLLTSHQGQGCVCPSCHYSSATQNCQCCVFRQLGKRGGPNARPSGDLKTTFTSPDLHLSPRRPFNLDPWKRLANIKDGDNEEGGVPFSKNGALRDDYEDNDWLKRPSSKTRKFMHYGDAMPGSVTSDETGYVVESKTRRDGGGGSAVVAPTRRRSFLRVERELGITMWDGEQGERVFNELQKPF